jgi:predicted MFS family arabinose efflux permease
VFRLPGVARLLVFATLARVPQTAAGVVLTLHVVTTLGLSYAAAGLVAATATVGLGLGGPWRGRAVDRVGLRRALVPSVVVATLAWGLAPFAGYAVLLVLAFTGGLLGIPIFGVTRQSLAVLAQGDLRRTAFSLDSIGTELSFMIGPTLGVLLATQFSTSVALWSVSALMLVSGTALIAFNPPTRSPGAGPEPGAPPEVGAPPDRSRWFSPNLIAVLAATAGATVVLAGTDVALVAHLRAHGAVGLAGAVMAAWGAGSMIGGLVYGGLHRERSPFLLLLGLALLTVPVGLAGGPVILMLTVLPAGLLCAPVITSTIEAVSRMVPESVRGEALGWHGSALQVGSALGAPLAGVAMDARGPWAGFALVGALGLVIAVVGLLVERSRRRRSGGRPGPVRHPQEVSI